MDYNFRQQLEQKFRSYQQLLSEQVSGEKIDLEEITKDFCEIDEWGRIGVRCIPATGDNVFFLVRNEQGEKIADIAVPISRTSDYILQTIVCIMRKAMIIEELRNTYTNPL